ncbi:spore germination protein [Paenibacillus doosanensis]|uniref:Spore germination protein B1 n=1 Tax=Paenibacillus konkukensis TaxID=2020716 RepID=A0ABY4RX13_9BACL|nr:MULTISPECIES: spore germination protein [Paenibacillus]MCS7458772.1 spore germination protein [Paenibacillus doosanensis]UQZ86702.1 Spore germination protein B1 [Paenibacillus konkukensis]
MSILKWFKRKKEAKPLVTISDRITETHQHEKINGSLNDALDFIIGILGENDDFVIRRFRVFGHYEAVMFYFSNMIDQGLVNTDILKPLMYLPAHLENKPIAPGRLTDVLLNETLYHSEGKLENKLIKLVEAILCGQTVVVVEGLDEAFLIGTRNIDKRSIDQPATEMVIRGSREGFIELLGTNIALLRYRLQTPDLRLHTMEIGRRTQSKVAICFMEGITNRELVDEVKNRLSKIDIDAVLDSGYLEQYIEDNHLSPFPQVQYTERPDKVAANLLEGRVAILVDGSPMALVVPTVFSQFYQTVEDYNERYLMMSSIRLARLVALIFSLIFPSLYVAIISFNPELIPTEFAVAVAGGRAGVPFPAIIEVLIIEISMEVLREATIRLPQQVGGALSIVGVLVVGQAAVAAGFASPITIVIIALTTIGSFATPAYNAALALRLLRFPLIFLGGIFGLYGIMIGLILIANHLLSLKSFGIPYLSPLVPGSLQGMKDLLIRGPLWWFKKRPTFLQTIDKRRIDPDVMDDIMNSSHNVLDPNNTSSKDGGKGGR